MSNYYLVNKVTSLLQKNSKTSLGVSERGKKTKQNKTKKTKTNKQTKKNKQKKTQNQPTKQKKKTLKSETKVFLLSGSGKIICVSVSVVCHPLFQPQGTALGADTCANPKRKCQLQMQPQVFTMCHYW